MALQKLAVVGLDNENQKRRLVETVNNILDPVVGQAAIGEILYPQTAAEIAAGVTPTNYAYPTTDVRRYGLINDGSTDNTTALRNAMLVIAQAGGGKLYFQPGTYRFTTVSTVSVRIPVANADFTAGTESHQYHVLMTNLTGVEWIGDNTILESTITNSGEMFMLDGARDFKCKGITLKSPHQHNASTGANIVTGMNGWGITSQSRDSYQLEFENCGATAIYVAMYIFGDEASSFRVRGVQINNFHHENGIYTIATHNNGDNVTGRGIQSSNTLREYFCYGADSGDIEMQSDTGVGAFTSLIKAYTRNTTNIKYKLKTSRNTTSVPAVHIHVEHDTTAQPTPFKNQNITVEVDNRGVTGTGVGVDFSYLQSGVVQATCATNIWDGIVIKGIFEQAPVANSVQAVPGTLNADEVVLLNGSLNTIWATKGFKDNKQTYNTFTPVLKINASATGITYSASTRGEYWRDGRFVEVLYRILLTAKGASVGAVTLDLPVATAPSGFNGINAMVVGEGAANMAGLSGPMCGFVATGGGTTLTLRVQGAAGVTSLADTNLTNTSDFRVWARYPIA